MLLRISLTSYDVTLCYIIKGKRYKIVILTVSRLFAYSLCIILSLLCIDCIKHLIVFHTK